MLEKKKHTVQKLHFYLIKDALTNVIDLNKTDLILAILKK